MMRAAALFAMMLFVSGCSEESASKDAEIANAADAAKDTAEAVKAEKKTIEEAAEAAVKLVEEESRQEIESLPPTNAQ